MPGFMELRPPDLFMDAAAFGLFTFATAFFVYAWRALGGRRYASLAAISALTGVYSLLGAVLKMAFHAGADAAALGLIASAQSLCIPFFLSVIPFYLGMFLVEPRGLRRFNLAASWIFLAFALAAVLVAAAYPPAYLSEYALSGEGLSYAIGPLYYATHVPAGVAIIYMVVLLAIDVLRWRNLKGEYFILAGSLASSVFAISSFWRMIFGSFLDPFSGLRFSRIVVALLLFGLITSAGFIRRFLGDAAQTRKAKERIDALLVTDSITGLPNRRAFSQDASAGDAGCTLLLDIDGFLDLNESYGSDTGDSILKGIGPALSPLLGYGARLYRIGGDEFAVLSPSGSEDAEALAARLKARLKEGIETEDGAYFPLDCSIAVSSLEDADGDGNAMLANTYSCLREAKREGNAVKRFSRAWHEGAIRRIETVRDLRADLDDGAFWLEYQPIHDADGGITGAEALLRWKKSDLYGGPAVFVPIAESAGIMPVLGRKVMEILVRDLREEILSGRLPRISVNLSPAQLLGPARGAYVEDVFDEAGLPPGAFQFEVTESMFLEGGSRATEVLERLRGRGSLIAIDDFGSGYSNLGYLSSLPVDKIKVDKSFIRSVPGNLRAEALVRSLADIGRSFGLGLLMEGVETEEQFAFLKGAGYREFQGFLFSRSLKPEAFISYARERS